MSLPLLVVVGALGSQGSGVVSAMLAASKPQYQIRALTSDTSSLSARSLATNPRISVEYVDLNSQDSVLKAFRDANYIFANTAFPIGMSIAEGPAFAQKAEQEYGMNVVRAAAQISSLRHIVWSTLPDAESITDGKYHIPHFQSKVPAEKYLQNPKNGLLGKSTILRVGFYASNLKLGLYKPLYIKAIEKYVLILPCLPTSRFPFTGDESRNTGTVVRAILSQPEKTLGNYVLGVSEYMSCSDWAHTFSKALSQQGKNVEVSFLETTLESYSRLQGHHAAEIGSMMEFFSDLKEESYTKGTAGSVLTPEDLGVQASMVSAEAMLEGMDWSSILA
ncbi:hypothetical protein ACHAPX_008171 [Trichoderma viride]